MEISFDVMILLFGASFVASCIDAIAGGGGLITLPALLASGLPPTIALGTNKLQATGGAFASSFYFIHKKKVNLKEFRLPITLTFCGGAIGSILIQILPNNFLNIAIAVLIFIIGVYFLLAPKFSEVDKVARISITTFAFCIAFTLGFYDGFLGPGTGSFLTLAFLVLLGFNLSKSVAHAKVLNFTSNFASLIFFILGGVVYWKVGLIMMLGSFLGGNIGARMVVSKGSTLIRPLIVIMSFSMMAKMLIDKGYFL